MTFAAWPARQLKLLQEPPAARSRRKCPRGSIRPLEERHPRFDFIEDGLVAPVLQFGKLLLLLGQLSGAQLGLLCTQCALSASSTSAVA
jgi:hypothetical protein